MSARRDHWDGTYARKAADEVSWFQRDPRTSLELVRAAGVPKAAPLIDVGAGASRLVDALLADGYTDVTLLDVSARALDVTRARLGDLASGVATLVADVTAWEPAREYALWHDRAVFHFLVDEADRAAYRAAMTKALAPGGAAIVATFADDGPERCSGLPVRRYSPEALASELAPLRAVESRREAHVTPLGGTQSFVFVRFVRD